MSFSIPKACIVPSCLGLKPFMLGNSWRRSIDNTMTALRSLVEELQVGLILVSHLKRIDGRAHEEGGATSLSHLRGSGGVAQFPDMVMGLGRNQQGDNPRLTTLQVLKNSYCGQTGPFGFLEYNLETGRMTEVKELPSESISAPYPQEPSLNGFLKRAVR